MLYREIIAVCFHIHTNNINTLCGQNGEFMDVKPGDAGPGGRSVKGVGPRPLACRNSGFESRRGMDVCLLCVLCFVK